VLAESTVAVAGLRAMGLAARYVSGYLETTPPRGRPRMVGADASHAWASVCTGVAPLKGVIFADAGEGVMEVAVDMIRVDRG